MDIIRDTIDRIEKEMPALSSLYVEDAVLGLFFTGVKLNNGSAGLAATPLKEIPEAVCCPSSIQAMPHPERILNMPVTHFFDYALSKKPLLRTLGLAVLEALIEQKWKKESLEWGDSFERVILDPQKKVVVVGALVPMLRRLSRNRIPYIVLEKDPRTLKGEEKDHYRPAEDYKEVLPHADQLIITGTTLLNGSFEELMACRKSNSFVLLVGPTASIDPDVLCKWNVSAVGGTLVQDADECLTLLRLGGSGYHLFEKSVRRFHLSLTDRI